MLTDEETREIATLLARYTHHEEAGPEALRVVQRHRGWISDKSLGEVARLLGMDPAALDSVATFYNRIYRKPFPRSAKRRIAAGETNGSGSVLEPILDRS